MWCEYDDDSDQDSSEERRDEKRGTATVPRRASMHPFSHRRPHRLLRILVQTLDGRVCDDEDEDSETDDGESETDREAESGGDDERDIRTTSRRSLWWERRRHRSNDLPRGNGDASRVSRERGRRAGNRWMKRASGARTSKREDEELDEVDCQRKEELASVLRRLRVAIRRMDGVLTEEKV